MFINWHCVNIFGILTRDFKMLTLKVLLWWFDYEKGHPRFAHTPIVLNTIQFWRLENVSVASFLYFCLRASCVCCFAVFHVCTDFQPRWVRAFTRAFHDFCWAGCFPSLPVSWVRFYRCCLSGLRFTQSSVWHQEEVFSLLSQSLSG